MTEVAKTPKKDIKLEDPALLAVAHEIAEKLEETLANPRGSIERIVALRGPEWAQALLEETLEVEAQGGMMIKSGKRRRTVGGVYLYLARKRLTAEERKIVFKKARRKKKKSKKADTTFPWARRMQLWKALLEKKGKASNVKITIIGRPKRIRKHEETVMMAMENTLKPTGFPKGVPAPPETPTTYTIYIGMKQWRRVEDAIKSNKEDELIVEGRCAFDPEVEGMAIFATFVTTKAIQQEQREAQRRQQESA